jgi:hypothetical protein
MHSAGTYDNDAFDLTTYVFDSDSLVSWATDNTSDSAATNVGDSYASYVHSHSTDHADDHHTTTLHEEGTYDNNGFDLNCYVYDESTQSHTNDHSWGDSLYSAPDSTTSANYDNHSYATTTFDLHAEGTYNDQTGLSLSSYSSTNQSSSLNTSHSYNGSAGTDWSNSSVTDSTSSSTSLLHADGTVDNGIVALASYVSDNTNGWDNSSQYNSSSAGTSFASTNHDWSSYHYHLEGSGTTGNWTENDSGGYYNTSTGADPSSGTWSYYTSGTTPISFVFQGVPLELDGPVFSFNVPGVTLPTRFELPGVVLITPSAEFPSSIYSGPVTPPPINLDLLIPAAANHNTLPQVAPNSSVGSNPSGIHGTGRAADAARQFTQRVDASLTAAPNVPTLTESVLRSAQLSSQFSVSQAQANLGNLQPSSLDKIAEMWAEAKKFTYDMGVLFLNGATFGTITPLREEAGKVGEEYGDATYWTVNIIGGVVAVVIVVGAAILTEGATVAPMLTGAVVGAGIDALYQTAGNIDKYGFSGFDHWTYDYVQMAGAAVIGAYVAGIAMIPGANVVLGAYALSQAPGAVMGTIDNFRNGNYVTGSLDIVMTLLPLASKGNARAANRAGTGTRPRPNRAVSSSSAVRPGRASRSPAPQPPRAGSNLQRPGQQNFTERSGRMQCPDGQCFRAGTPVLTLDGRRPIEEICDGDKVWSFDLVSQRWSVRSVVEVYELDYEGKIVTVGIDGEEIDSTAHHPYWVVKGMMLNHRPVPIHAPEHLHVKSPGRWVDATDLQIGDILLLRSGRQVPVTNLAIQHMAVKVYNFHVAELHCYAVGKCDVLVHNAKKYPKGSKRDRAGQRTEEGKNAAQTNRKPGKGADGRGDSSKKRQIGSKKKAAQTKREQLQRAREAEAVKRYNDLGEDARKLIEKNVNGREEAIKKILEGLIRDNWRPPG